MPKTSGRQIFDLLSPLFGRDCDLTKKLGFQVVPESREVCVISWKSGFVLAERKRPISYSTGVLLFPDRAEIITDSREGWEFLGVRHSETWNNYSEDKVR